MPSKLSTWCFGLSCLLAACNSNTDKTAATDFLAQNIDTTVKPSEDFFLYANGGWIKRTPIPAEENGWGIGYLVQEDIFKRLRTSSEDALKENAARGSISQKIGDFWYSGMDSVEIEKQGLAPLKADLEKINAVQTTTDIIDITADFHQKGIDVIFADYVAQDDKNSDAMAYQLYQGGLGLPNRDYYFNTDSITVGVRKAYSNYLITTLKQLGYDSAKAGKAAQDVYELEKRLAGASRKLADLRDPYKNYNKMPIASIAALSPGIDRFFQKVGVTKIDSVIVGQPEFYAAVGKELRATPVEIWKDYLRLNLVRASAPYLDKQTYANIFELRKALSGVTQQRPRWKRVVVAEENAMGEALGQLFVKEYFNEKAKERYTRLVAAVREAYAARIDKLSWMSDSTKKMAHRKLEKITGKIGYPDKWKDFSSLEIDRGPFVLNVQRANRFWFADAVNKLGKPVDRTEWSMSPQTYNAYYNASNNEIVLPAGIFIVPGKKDEDLDDAFVYGYAAASTIGHELTHGFDDQGRQYDEKGNLRDWWQPADGEQFKQRAKAIIKQFNEFNPVDTLHINGDATQGENIADLGGLLLGLDAYKKTEEFRKNEKIGGFTPLQRYFLGYAYGWLYSDRKESLANLVMTDVHAPAKERVNGPVVNVPEFYEAFNVKPGDKMYRPDSLRVSIW